VNGSPRKHRTIVANFFSRSPKRLAHVSYSIHSWSIHQDIQEILAVGRRPFLEPFG
jgi:hypothetical protein